MAHPALRPRPQARAPRHTASRYQVFLDGQDAAPGGLAVGSLACDDDGLRVAVLCRKVDLGVAFLPDLQGARGP